MAINFQTFCDVRTVDVKITLPLVTDEVPEVYKATMDRVLKDLSNRVELFDRTSVPYIQDTIEKVADMDKALEHTSGDVPSAILENVSTTLYGKSFNDVTIDQQSIIIIVSTYICVARNSKL